MENSMGQKVTNSDELPHVEVEVASDLDYNLHYDCNDYYYFDPDIGRNKMVDVFLRPYLLVNSNHSFLVLVPIEIDFDEYFVLMMMLSLQDYY